MASDDMARKLSDFEQKNRNNLQFQNINYLRFEKQTFKDFQQLEPRYTFQLHTVCKQLFLFYKNPKSFHHVQNKNTRKVLVLSL